MHTFPMDGGVGRKCGGLPLGLVVCPLGGLSSLCGSGGVGDVVDSVGGNAPVMNGTLAWNGREQGDIYSVDSNNRIADGKGDYPSEVDYIPLVADAIPDPERVPVLRGSKPRSPTPQQQHQQHHQHHHEQSDKPSSTSSRAIAPPRCNRCQAYLNPFCTPVAPSSSSSFRVPGMAGAYAPIQHYNCNMCGSHASIALSEEFISNGTVDAATRCGTVEYEVGGAYCVRERPVENVHLYGVEYTPFNGVGGTRGQQQQQKGKQNQQHHPQQQNQHHQHHGTMESYGWNETLDAIMEVAKGLRQTAPVMEVDNVSQLGGGSSSGVGATTTTVSSVKIGVFAFCQDMLVFPYLKQKRDSHSNDGGNTPHEKPQHGNDTDFNGEEEEIAIAIVSDVMEDPFCPLPLSMWTYNIGNRHNANDWKRFCRVMESFSEVMEQLVKDSLRFVTPSSPSQQVPVKWMRNCGGAALSALADALKDSGGRWVCLRFNNALLVF